MIGASKETAAGCNSLNDPYKSLNKKNELPKCPQAIAAMSFAIDHDHPTTL